MTSTWKRLCLSSCVFALVAATTAVAQSAEPAAPAPADDASEPVGVRFTPAMARNIATQLVQKGLKSHYELPDDKQDEAIEKLTRRFMELAHATDGPAQELVQRFVEELLANQKAGQPNEFMPPGFGREFADRIQTVLPAVRQLVRGIGQDLRPMLPMKQQLKLAGELMGAKTGLDAFEKTMQKWSSGEVTDFSELFGHESKKQVKKDETGQSSELKSARETASSQLEKFALAEWDAYVAEFKTFYGLDAPQQATVDSILREFKERAQTRKRDAAWQARYYRNRLWLNIFWRVPDSWNHPVQVLVQDDQDEATSWLDELSRDLKARLDSVPTRSQQEQADARVDSLLKEKGIEITEATP